MLVDRSLVRHVNVPEADGTLMVPLVAAVRIIQAAEMPHGCCTRFIVDVENG